MDLSYVSEKMSEINSDLKSECRNHLLKVAFLLLQPSSQDRSKLLDKLSADFNVPIEIITEILGLYIAVIQLLPDSKGDGKNEHFLQLGFHPDFIEHLPLITSRTKIMSTISNSTKCIQNKFVELNWRIDISVHNSVVKKQINSVVLCLHIKNGKQYTITVDLKTFHNLRLNIGLILKEVNNLKSSSLFNK